MESLSLCWKCIVNVLLLLSIANGMPVLASNIFRARFSWPVDFGINFYNKYPLFGYSKTWRGVFASVFTTSLLAPLFGLSIYNGALFGILVMTGDLSASFIKRRLGYTESSRFRIIDIIPESLLPVLVLHKQLELTMMDGIISIALFFILEVVLSPLLYRLHIRKRPY